AAPLIAGNDVRKMSESTRAILTNKEVIAVDQDALGISGFAHRKEAGVEIWVKPLAGDAWAMALLNRNREPRPVTIDWKKERFEDAQNQRDTVFAKTTYALRNLFSHASAGTTTAPLKVTVAGHDVAMFRLDRRNP